MSRDVIWLMDICNAARDVLAFSAGIDFCEFERDRKTQAAILHRLMVIGEATKRLSSEFRESHPEQPWLRIAGLRDRLIHEYDGVNLARVWDVVQNYVPELIRLLEPLIPLEPPDKS